MTLISLMFVGIFSTNIYAQTNITVTVNGTVKIDGQTDNSGISVIAKSYKFNGVDIFSINKSTTTNASGNYSITLSVPSLAFSFSDIGVIPMYYVLSKDAMKDSINENIPVTQPYQNFTYTISKKPVLGAIYTPQISLVTVDTTFGVNKNMIIWQRKNDATIDHYNILKSTMINGKKDSIGSVLQTADFSVFRDPSTTPSGKIKTIYKVEAVYKNNKKSPLSYPKAPLSVNASFDPVSKDSIPKLNFLKPEDIALFDHELYKSISVLRKDGSAKIFREYKKFDFITKGDSSLMEMLAGWQDAKQILSKYVYLLSGELKNSFMTDKPNMLKSDSGPFSQSLSNLAESELKDLTYAENVEALSLQISPNPSKGQVKITIPEAGTLLIINDIGAVISSNIVSQGSSQLEIKAPGIYYIILKASNSYKSTIVIE